MKPIKFRWSKVYESQEEELVELLQARGLATERNVAEEFQIFADTPMEQDTTMWCAEGSASLHISGTKISFQPGDAIRLLTGTKLSISAGMSGCVWYETLA